MMHRFRHISWLACVAMVFATGIVPRGLLVMCDAGDEHLALELAHQESDCTTPENDEPGWSEDAGCLDTAVDFLDEAVLRQSSLSDWSPQTLTQAVVFSPRELSHPVWQRHGTVLSTEPLLNDLHVLRSVILQV